jgi:hypothetical protein
MGDAQVDATNATMDSSADQAAPPPPAAGGTGAFGIVTVGGKQKMYLPQSSLLPNGDYWVAAVDVGKAGNGVNGTPAQIAAIDLGPATLGDNRATATGGDSNVVIAVSTANGIISFINPQTDTLEKTIQLDATYGQSNFSGGGGYVTGVAVDSPHHRAILSVWNGFAIVDLTTQTISTLIQAPPTENFGFDSVHQLIFAPFYDCTSSSAITPDGGVIPPASCGTPMTPEGGVITDGLSVIDLSDNSVYTYEAPAVPPDAGQYGIYDPTNPVGSEPDSAAADPTTGVVVVPSEGSGWQNVIDFSKATYDRATHTVTAPQTIVPSLDFDAVAIEPNSHLAFWEQEFASTIAIASLPQLAAGGGAAVQATMPQVPGGASFANLGDPHGIAVTTALSTAGPVGFVVDSSLQWVARIDLAGALAAGGGDATISDAMLAPYVTYLDALTPENAVPDGGGDGAAEASQEGGD